MFHPEFTIEIARQHQQQLASNARVHRAVRPVAGDAAMPKRAPRRFLASLVIPGLQHAG